VTVNLSQNQAATLPDVTRHQTFAMGKSKSSVCSTSTPAVFTSATTGIVDTNATLPPSAASTSISVDQSDLVKPAVKAFQLGDRAGFETSYEAALKQSNALPTAPIFLAKLQIDSGRIGDAMATLEQYAMVSSNDPETYIALGEIALRASRVTDAWLQLKHADELMMQDKIRESRRNFVTPGLVELRAEVAERRQQWDEAEALFGKLVVLRPDSSLPTWRLGRTKVLRGEIEQGIELMNLACQKDRKLAAPELTTAMILVEQKKDTEAEKWFQAAIRKDQEDPIGVNAYLNWLLLNDRDEDARGLIDKLPVEVLANRNIQVRQGIAARYAGDFLKAESVFSALSQLAPDDLEVADQLALVLVESPNEGKRARAAQISESNLRRLPNNETTIATAAWVQFKLGSIDVADQLLGKLVGQISLSPQTAFYVSELLKANGKSEESKKVLEAAIRSPGIFPDRKRARKLL